MKISAQNMRRRNIYVNRRLKRIGVVAFQNLLAKQFFNVRFCVFVTFDLILYFPIPHNTLCPHPLAARPPPQNALTIKGEVV